MARETASVIEAHNVAMDPDNPRAGGPRRRRAFSASDKLAHLDGYERAVEEGEGGAYLRREGLYSSLISEWRKQRDAGVLTGRAPGGEAREAVGRASRDRAAQA